MKVSREELDRVADELGRPARVIPALADLIARGGYPCLGCEKPTTAEGQVCSGCVSRGVRVENDKVLVDLEIRLPEWMTR